MQKFEFCIASVVLQSDMLSLQRGRARDEAYRSQIDCSKSREPKHSCIYVQRDTVPCSGECQIGSNPLCIMAWYMKTLKNQ